MGKPDELLHRADHGSGQGDNNNFTLLLPTLFYIYALSSMQLEGNECNILKVRQSLQHDALEELVVMAVQELCVEAHSRALSGQKVMGYSCSEVRSMSPKTESLGITFGQHHGTCIAVHAGHFKILELISRNYWWPQMSRYIRSYVKTCDLCNRTKPQHHQPYRELNPAETPDD
jgi:hypothetical protein